MIRSSARLTRLWGLLDYEVTRHEVTGIEEVAWRIFFRAKSPRNHLLRSEESLIYDVVLGRSELSLESYLNRLERKHLVKAVCMDLAVAYHALVSKYFPQARIVADRFHVVRLVNHHFLACWRNPTGSKNHACSL